MPSFRHCQLYIRISTEQAKYKLLNKIVAGKKKRMKKNVYMSEQP